MEQTATVRLSSRVSGVPLVNRIQQMKQLAHEMQQDGIQVEDFTAGEPDFDTPQHIKQAAKSALDQDYTHYTSNRGLRDVRQAIAEKMSRDSGLEVDAESEVVITNGGKQALFVTLNALVSPGDEVITQDPYFGPFGTITRLAGGEPVHAKSTLVDGLFRPDVDEIERRITERTRVIIVNSPCNPTGTVYSREELQRIGELAVEHNLFIISDEVYERIIYDDVQHHSIAALSPEFQQRTITINSLSKTYAMTGWRFGYLAAPKPVADAAAYLNQNSARMSTAFVQMAAKEALLGDQQPATKMVEVYRERRQLIVDGLNAIPSLECASPQGTFYVFLRGSQFGMTSFELAQHLLSAGHVATTPGDFFGPSGEGYVRLSFATDENTITRGLEGIRVGVQALES